MKVVSAGFGTEGREITPLMSRPGTRIGLAVQVAPPSAIVAIEIGDSVLDSMLDSSGEPLSASEFDYSTEIAPDGSVGLFSVKAEGVPGAQASAVKARGRLAVKLATGVRTERVAAVRLEPGATFLLAGATVKVEQLRAEGENSTVDFKGPSAVLGAVKALRFIEAGQAVETHRSSFSVRADEAELSYYAPLKGSRVALEVTLYQNLTAVQVPIDVQAGVGLAALAGTAVPAEPAPKPQGGKPSGVPSPAVALAGFSVTGPRFGAEEEPLGGTPGTDMALAVHVPAPAGILGIRGEAESLRLRDSGGSELEEPEFESGSPDITADGQVAVLELRASGRPAPRAAAVAAAGTLMVTVSARSRTEKVASVKLTPSSTFRLGRQTLTVGAAEASGDTTSIGLTGPPAVLDAIKALRFRARGAAAVEARLTGRSWGGEETMRYYSIPTTATAGSLEVDLWQNPTELAVPFDIQTGIGVPTVAFATAGPLPPLPPLGTVTGQFVVDGKPLPLAHVVAVSGPDNFDETKEAFTVLLTEKPIAVAAVDGAADLRAITKAVDEGLVVKFGPGGSSHVTVRHPVLAGRELQTSGGGKPLDLRGPERVAGSVVTWPDGKEQEFPGGHKVAYSVRFNAPIRKRFALEEPLVLAAKATRLGPGGGDPGKVYLADQCGALPFDAKDPKALEAYLQKEGKMPTEQDLAEISKQEGKTITKEDALQLMAGLMELAGAFRPKDCKVLGGAQDGKLAILQVEAIMMESRSRADVYLVKEAGKWKFKKHGAWREAK